MPLDDDANFNFEDTGSLSMANSGNSVYYRSTSNIKLENSFRSPSSETEI